MDSTNEEEVEIKSGEREKGVWEQLSTSDTVITPCGICKLDEWQANEAKTRTRVPFPIGVNT